MSSPLRRSLALAIALACCAGSVSAASVHGRIATADGRDALAGAGVRVAELNRHATAQRDGRFRIGGLPAGRYTLEVTYLGAAPVTRSITVGEGDTALGDIAVGAAIERLANVLVVGQVAGQAAALNAQRTADTVVSIVASDAIGQFPDQNTTEALQRLPGVSISRDQGEGRYVAVRGIDPSLNAVTIQGARVPSPERDNRSVQLDVIPSELLERLEVHKTATPDMDADGMGGTIEIKSLSALDRPGFSVSGKVEAGYSDLRDAWSPKLSASLTNTWGEHDDVGLAIAASSHNRRFGSDNIETDGYTTFELPSGEEVRAPDEIEQRDYRIERERQALTANLDWRASDSTRLYLRTLWSDFTDDEVRTRNEFRLGDGNLLSADGDALGLERVRVEKSTKLRLEEARIWSAQLGGSSLLGDAWTLDYSLARSQAEEREPGRIDADFRSGRMPLRVDGFPGNTPWVVTPDQARYDDPAGYGLRTVEIADNQTRDQENALRFDARRELDWGSVPGYLKMGWKSRWREKRDDQSIAVYDDFPTSINLTGLVRDGFDYPLGDLGLGIDPAAFRALVGAQQGGWGLNALETTIADLGGDYRLSEDVHAAYAMAGADWDGFSLIAGVRAERTAFDAQGNIAVIDADSETLDITAVDARRRYTDVLPGLHGRWTLGENAQLRASFTQSVVRAGFRHLAPSQLIEFEDDDGSIVRKAEIGNPDLDPLRSNNFDVMFEWYPGDVGVLTAGVFHKDIRDFVVLADIAGSGPWTAYEEVIAPVNGPSATLRGVELGWVHTIAAVPGLLVNANATWTDSEARLPFRADSVLLPFQSDLVANLALGYERGPLSLRLSGSYRDERFLEAGELDDPSYDLYEDAHLQVDFSARLRLGESWRLYFEATNLNDRPMVTYVGSPGYLGSYERYGRSFALGLQFNH